MKLQNFFSVYLFKYTLEIPIYSDLQDSHWKDIYKVEVTAYAQIKEVWGTPTVSPHN